MFFQKITFKNLGKTDEKERIEHFICCLKNNGQILSQDMLVSNDSDYTLYVTTPKCDSLNGCFDSKYAKDVRDELSKYYSITVTHIGYNVYSQEYCSCHERTAIEMQTYENDLDSVFTCCTCGKPIALYELPCLATQDDHWYIVFWQNTYRATDTLWLNSLSDRFTGNQLTNPNSVLNKNGRKIADELSQKTGLKFYYNIFDDLTKKVKITVIDDIPVRLCPCCEKPMKYIKFCEDYERLICDDCNISSDLIKLSN